MPARLQQQRISRFLRELSQEGSRPAAYPAGAGHCRGDLEWAAAGGAAVGPPDAAVSGGVVCAIAGPWLPAQLLMTEWYLQQVGDCNFGNSPNQQTEIT
jgi:hypothetical protein